MLGLHSYRQLVWATAVGLPFVCPASSYGQGLSSEVALGYNAFGEIGDGPGVTALLGYAWRSGLQLGFRGEYYFPNTVTDAAGFEERWSEIGIYAELRARFRPSRRSGPVAGLLFGNQWYVGEGFTEADGTFGAVAGYEFTLSPRLLLQSIILATHGDLPELDKKRIGVFLGVRYRLPGGSGPAASCGGSEFAAAATAYNIGLASDVSCHDPGGKR